ncbi:MAG: hypothetical protein PHD00_10025 [Bacteroidales bacterium]|nr:hypothetical protein [Bacteroidales bacterium]MDD4672964.1 hypothetical protein [Bacteroidales bacterium]MDY0349222.1 hypothetical protein [Tenuifilaceae bacterium]
MKTINYTLKSVLFLVAMLVVSTSLQAQRKAKKHKHAPEEVIVLVVGKVNPSFDEAQFPHLKFYYLKDLAFNVAENPNPNSFLARWDSKWGLVNPSYISTLLLDNNGVVAYQRSYHKNFGDRPYEDADLYGNIIVSDQKKPKKKPLEEYLKNHVTKGKLAKVNPNKSYTEGQEPNFKGWDKGNIEGMELPNFDVEDASGKSCSIKDLTNGKASFIVFMGMDPNANYKNSIHPIPMLWHIENTFYKYYQPRNRR